MTDQYFLTTDGTTICYQESGQGKSLIFVHGFPFNSSSWNPQFRYFSQHARVISYDQRGFGKSEAGSLPFSMDLFAEDLIGLMDAVEMETSVFCGLSMGGYVLMNLAARFPDRIDGLVLCDTQCRADTPDARMARSSATELIQSGGKEEFVTKMISKLFAPITIKVQPELVQMVHTQMMAASDQTIINTLNALATRRDSCDLHLEGKIPALILAGELDGITPPNLHHELHTQLNGSRLELIADAGHLSNLEQPDKFNSLLLQFLNNF